MIRPKIWLYWDNIPPATEAPAYIQLCWETIKRHCEADFYIHLVTTENVRDFLPNISDSFFQIAQINNKSNFLRYTLLKEFGGIWLDSDLVLFRSLKPILELSKDGIDLIATASPGLKYGEAEAGFLVSTKNGPIISKAVSLIEHALNLQKAGHVFKWGSLGPSIVRQAIKGRTYHHLDHRLIQPIASWEDFKFEGKESIDKYCDEKSLGVMLFHQMFKQRGSKFLTMNRQQLLESPTLLGQMFRKALNEG